MNKDDIKPKVRNIIPIGRTDFSTMGNLFGARLVATFAHIRKPPKFASALLLLICNRSQKENLYTVGNNIRGVELSTREIGKEFRTSHVTISKTLQWLEKNDWVSVEAGCNQSIKTVVKVNLEMVKQFTETPSPKFKPTYDDYDEWKSILQKLKNRR